MHFNLPAEDTPPEQHEAESSCPSRIVTLEATIDAMASQIQLLAEAISPAIASPTSAPARRHTPGTKKTAIHAASSADTLLGRNIRLPPPQHGGGNSNAAQQALACSCGALISPNAIFCCKCGREHPPGETP